MNRCSWPRIGAPALTLLLAIGCGRSAPSHSGGGAKSVDELLDRFEVALASGDGEAVAALVNAPDDGFIRDKYRHAKEIEAARLELDAALDKAFGAPPAGRTDAFGSPVTQMVIAAMSWKKNDKIPKLEMTVKSQKPLPDGTTLLTVDQVFEVDGTSKVKSETITVFETKDGWKLVRPKEFHPQGADRFEVEKQVAELLRGRAREVAAGAFKNRGEAEDLTALECMPILSRLFGDSVPDELLPRLQDESRRLGLMPLEQSGLPEPVPVAVRARSAGPGKLRLEFDATERDVPLDALTDGLKQSLVAPAAAAEAPIEITILGGIPAEDLLKLFHSLVDLRPDAPQGIRLAVEKPSELKAIESRLGGRLKLLTVADRPYTIDLEPAVEGAPVETTLVPDLPASIENPVSPLEMKEKSPAGAGDSISVPAPSAVGIPSATPPPSLGSPSPTSKKP